MLSYKCILKSPLSSKIPLGACDKQLNSYTVGTVEKNSVTKIMLSSLAMNSSYDLYLSRTLYGHSSLVHPVLHFVPSFTNTISAQYWQPRFFFSYNGIIRNFLTHSLSSVGSPFQPFWTASSGIAFLPCCWKYFQRFYRC